MLHLWILHVQLQTLLEHRQMLCVQLLLIQMVQQWHLWEWDLQDRLVDSIHRIFIRWVVHRDRHSRQLRAARLSRLAE